MSATSQVPDGTVTEVLDWVGDDPERAQAALVAEREGSNRSTLIAQLETISCKEDAVTDETTATADETEEDNGLAPAPEQPSDVEVYAGDRGTTVLPVSVRDPDVDPAEHDLTPDVDAERDDTLIEGEQVESITGAIASNGAAISINGSVFVFNGQMVGALKQVVDKAVVGLSL